ncbi:ferritin-like domain-containing protein [Robiginitomaculum antarcticum]|uniref:ferritin-like domain-containing protein n=1 Tax=Robiginitomaculum antarcticum TaxID=437507 RepID=UPI0003607703|nr:PA2169 family four-helix-bundle protein [Robiginitomaculum antarcticum]
MDITNTPTPGVQTKEDVIEEVNDVTRLMIDSYKGYQAACEECDDSFRLANEFKQRAERRKGYISELQGYVRTLGGEPSTHGTMRGAVHRGWLNFANIFQDDEKGAINAVENGESFLANRIEDCLHDGQLDANATALMKKAHADVKKGARFFDMLDDAT